MRRLKGDRGAVALIVAMIMVPLLICTALVVDIGTAYVRQRELQNAADAAALAIAVDCASGDCKVMTTTANTYADKNVGSGTVTAKPSPKGNSVTVSTTSNVDFTFMPGSVDPEATATAAWGSPTGGTAVLPLAFSWCAFNSQTHGGVPSPVTPYKIYTSKGDNTTCHGPSGNDVPGGFGWLKIDPGPGCKTTTSINQQASSDPGNSGPCAESYYTSQLNKTVLLPIYDAAGGTGTNAWYHIYAYAAFHLTGFNFGGAKKNWVEGYFIEFVDPSNAFTYGAGAPDLGVHVVTLTK